jgi:hypothetical protein
LRLDPRGDAGDNDGRVRHLRSTAFASFKKARRRRWKKEEMGEGGRGGEEAITELAIYTVWAHGSRCMVPPAEQAQAGEGRGSKPPHAWDPYPATS